MIIQHCQRYINNLKRSETHSEIKRSKFFLEFYFFLFLFFGKILFGFLNLSNVYFNSKTLKFYFFHPWTFQLQFCHNIFIEFVYLLNSPNKHKMINIFSFLGLLILKYQFILENQFIFIQFVYFCVQIDLKYYILCNVNLINKKGIC